MAAVETQIGSRAASTSVERPADASSTFPARARRTSDVAALPAPSPRLLRWFTRYARWYVARHFHAVRCLTAASPRVPPDRPLVVYLNHASWWDPLLCLIVRDTWFAARPGFAPIDAAMLGRYRFFGRLGFFGVDQHHPRGAARFLRVAQAVLARPDATLWLTPQGRFSDVRERPLGFKPGLGHLAARGQGVVFLPLALEIVPWQERTPEALLAFGEPVIPGPRELHSAGAWTELLQSRLATVMDRLSQAAIRREPAAFRTLLAGGAGVGGVYDLWRRLRARLRGEAFDPRHGGA